LRVLAQDVVSRDYQEIVRTMLITDLEEEWKRVATPDNYIVFMQIHGGRERVLGNSELKFEPTLKRLYAKG